LHAFAIAAAFFQLSPLISPDAFPSFRHFFFFFIDARFFDFRYTIMVSQ